MITGAANGIGRATVEKLAENGGDVIGVDKDFEALEKLPEEVETVECDVRDEEWVKNVLEGRKFDVLVNCAGFYELGAVSDMDSETVGRIFDTNFHGYRNFIKHSTETLRENDGRVVNVSSVVGKISMPYFGVYSASKHAVEAMSDALRIEEKHHGVEVVVVEPGPVETGFNERARTALEKYVPESVYSERYEEKLASDGMEGSSPEEAAETVVKAIKRSNPRRRYRVRARDSLSIKLKQLLPEFLWDRILDRMFY